jgi:hypothetical protein
VAAYEEPGGRVTVVYPLFNADELRMATSPDGVHWSVPTTIATGKTDILEGEYGGESYEGFYSPTVATATVNGARVGLAAWIDYDNSLRAAWLPTLPPATGCVAPVLGRLRISPTRFRAAPYGGSIAPKPRRRTHHPTGTTVTYTDSIAATTTFTVLAPGIKRANSCVAPPRRGHKHGTACWRALAATTFKHVDTPGVNSFHYTAAFNSGSFAGSLADGRFLLQAQATLAGRPPSHVLTVRFQITG